MAPLCMLDDLWQAPPSCDISPFTFRAWPHSKAESSGTHQFTDLLREHSHITLPADLFGVIVYLVKLPQEKWACDFLDDATPLSFQLQVTEDFF